MAQPSADFNYDGVPADETGVGGSGEELA